MSTRARLPEDYLQNNNGALGKMGGKHKDQMNAMFDTRAGDTENYQKRLVDALEQNKKKYDQ